MSMTAHFLLFFLILDFLGFLFFFEQASLYLLCWTGVIASQGASFS